MHINRLTLSPQDSTVVPDRSLPMLDTGIGKETVVFLHGLFGSPNNWLSLMKDLSNSYRVVAPSLPIDRQPDRLKNGVKSISELTCHIADIIDGLQLKNFVVCGNSLGGLIGIDYCLRHPNRVAGLVLVGSAGLYESSVTNGAKPRVSREFVRSVIAGIFYNDELVTDELVEEWYQTIHDREYVRFILRLSRATHQRNVADELYKLSLPTMIVWGRNDVITPPHVAERFKSQIPGARLQYIDHCGHAPSIEQPEILTKIIHEFLPDCFKTKGESSPPTTNLVL